MSINKVIEAAEDLLRAVDRFSHHYGTSCFDDDADRLQDAIEAFRMGCPGCRETLDGKLICCNPDAVAAHNKEVADGTDI